MIGYKAFNEDLTCSGFQYEIGKTYDLEGDIKICNNGFHFCKSIADTYNFYPASENTRICKVEVLGDIISKGPKYCTNKIKILEEVTEEWERKGNSTSTSTGYCNTGLDNSGSYNTGNKNSGYCNVGFSNLGNCNTGHYNAGDYNSGNANAGNHNTGNRNIGKANSGFNNTGNYNTGNHNYGNFNTGNFNSGNRNVGDFNTSDYNIGCFNTINNLNDKIKLFNRESDMTLKEWINSKANCILSYLFKPVTRWVIADNMTEEEKIDNPNYKTSNGYLKVLDAKESAQLNWDNLSEEYKNEVLSLPNFDKEIFKNCTGIDVGDITK